MQDQRGKREVIHPIHLLRDLYLLLVVAVNLDQNFNPERVRLSRELGDELKRLWNHEATRAGLFNRIADRVETNQAYACVSKALQDRLQVRLSFRILNVN